MKKSSLALMLTMTALTMMTMIGCQNADPSARSNRVAYRDVGSRIHINGASNTVCVTNSIGDGLYASADGGGDMQENSPTQTTDTKPEVAVGVGGGSAGTGGATPSSGIVGEALNKLMGIFSGSAPVGTKLTAEEAKAITDCVDGNCTVPQ